MHYHKKGYLLLDATISILIVASMLGLCCHLHTFCLKNVMHSKLRLEALFLARNYSELILAGIQEPVPQSKHFYLACTIKNEGRFFWVTVSAFSKSKEYSVAPISLTVGIIDGREKV